VAVLLGALALARAAPAPAAPQLQYSPPRFDAELPAGLSTSASLVLRNSGDAPLEVTLAVRDGRLLGARSRGVAGGFVGLRIAGSEPDGGSPPGARNAAPWASGPGPWPEESPAPVAPRAAGRALRVLIVHSAGAVSSLRDQLLAFPEFESVDVWDVTAATLPLAVLETHDAVLVAVNSGAYHPDVLGDSLATFVDRGGGVVLSLASFVSGYEIRGRLLLEEYMPFRITSTSRSSASLGEHDVGHPILSGVGRVEGQLLSAPEATAGAEVVARWSDGRVFVATKPGVAGLNLFAAVPGYWSGDVPLLFRNALLWSAGKSPWLRPSATRVTVPPGSETVMEVAIDAASLTAGSYAAELVLVHNDPALPEAHIPASLLVRGAPRMRLSSGQNQLESTSVFGEQGEETSHRLVVGNPPPESMLLDLLVEGDFGDGGEVATVAVEGVTLGGAGQVGLDCEPALRTFAIVPTLARQLLADGVVDATVRNTALVDPLCETNRHTVRLRFERPAEPLESGSVFVGASAEGLLHVGNTGSDVLVVTSVRTSDAVFVPDHDSLSVAPGRSRTVRIRFTPVTVGPTLATLRFASNDPQATATVLQLRGTGLPPPDVDLEPDDMYADLPMGGITNRTLELNNRGGSPLTFRLRARSEVRPGPRPGAVPVPGDPFVPTPGLPEAAGVADGEAQSPGPASTPEPPAHPPSSGEPGSRPPRPARPMAMPGARVLILQDFAPWLTRSNENVLSGLGVPFEIATSDVLDTLDLFRYAMVLIASDQSDLTYERLGERWQRFEDFVGAGGVLEVHAAGWGFNQGDATRLVLPGSSKVRRNSSSLNHVVLPFHPLAQGVPQSIPGTSTSHAWFGDLPTSVDVVAHDDRGFPVLVSYPLGRGLVVASGQTLEFAHAYGQAAAPILENTIRYSLDATPQWLGYEPASGVIPPGGSLPVIVQIDAGGLDEGGYSAELLVLSDDPDERVREVRVAARVAGSPNLEIAGRPVVVESRTPYIVTGALTTHRLSIDRPPGSSVALELQVTGDFDNEGEEAVVTVEGFEFGAVGPIDNACSTGRRTFLISPAFADRVLADGVLEVSVQNSDFVNPICARNEHRVRAAHAEHPFPLQFKMAFVGGCDERGFQVANRGSARLVVSAVTVAPASFRVSPASFTLEPRHEQVVTVRFCPGSPGLVVGELRISSNDPNAAGTSLTVSGTALPAPVLSLSATAFSADLLAGEAASHSFRVGNSGASPLELRVLARGGLRQPETNPPAGVPAEPPASPSSPLAQPPSLPAEGPAPLPPLAAAAAARVLLVEDLPPWGRLHDEALLDELGIAFDRVTSSGLAGTDLTSYDAVLIAGDQSSAFYGVVGGQVPRLAAFVEAGGTLEAHVAGWGSNFGDASVLGLPGGVGIQFRLADLNRVELPGHPILAGVENPFRGTYASHGHLSGLPAGALRLASDDVGGTTLAEYPLGSGRVIAGTIPFEYGIAAAQPAGVILRNLVPYALAGAGGWLSADPVRATLAPGDSLAVAATIETALLSPGRYVGEVQLTSNDPVGGFRSVPFELRLANVPATLRLERRDLVRSGDRRPLAIGLELAPGHDARAVRLATVRLNGVPADTSRRHGERDRDEDDDDLRAPAGELHAEREGRDGRSRRLRLRFNREQVLLTLPGEGPQPLVLSGALAGEDRFLARDTVTVGGGEREDDEDDDVVAGGAAGRAVEPAIPLTASLRLGPNPVSGAALRLELSLPRPGPTRIEVFSLDGRLVRTLAAGELAAGVHAMGWDGHDAAARPAASGVYLLRVRAPGLETVRRVIRVN
jgi:hypothetical protein